MPEFTKIAVDGLLRIRQQLLKTASLEKRAQVAELLADTQRRVMALVAGGHLDPEIAIEKVAEFTSEPRLLDVFETAVGLGSSDTTKLGSATTDLANEVAGTSPEDRYARRVREIADEQEA